MIFRAIGLMSGTSLDGLDICCVVFEKTGSGNWNFEIEQAQTLSYPQFWENQLRESINLSSENLLSLNSEYGFYLGEKVKEFIAEFSLKNIDVIASHGHTVFHQPQKKFTLQIGDGRAIKILNQIPVVYDFRSQDVLMDGNGAPLVPIGDELLFTDFDSCLNLGGFSNISFKKNSKRIAFDICPVNIVLNEFALALGKNYDENGDLARNGTIDPEILSALNSLKFYQDNPAKSLGIEWIHQNVSPLLQNETPQNILATVTEHAAIQIAEILNQNQLKNVLVTGGGAYNAFLIERLKTKTNTEIVIPDSKIIDFKEALIFAFMGVLRITGENNVLSSATGSFQDHSTGIIA